MLATFNYGIIYGKGDGSDVFEWEMELTEKERPVYLRAFMIGDDGTYNTPPELEAIFDRARAQIEEQEIDNGIVGEDELTLESRGLPPMDADLLNDLVHGRDRHALEFFGLLDAPTYEIDN